MTYEDDPRWQAARARWMQERGKDESPAEHYTRGVAALYAMHRVEVEYEESVA